MLCQQAWTLKSSDPHTPQVVGLLQGLLADQTGYLILHPWLPLYMQDDSTIASYQASEVTALKGRGHSAATAEWEVACLSEAGSRVGAGFPIVRCFPG